MSLPTLDSKWFPAIAPAAIIDNAAATGVAIDTRGGDYLEIIMNLGATDVAAVSITLEASATSAGAYTAVSNSVFGTDAGIGGTVSVLPTALNDGGLFGYLIDVRKLPFPFVKIIYTCGNGAAGTFISAVARLSNLERSPRTAVEAGFKVSTALVAI